MSYKENSNHRIGFTTNWTRTNFDVMQPKEIGFAHPPRRWQAECFETIAPNHPIAFINAPTGSGKSTMLSMLAYHRTLNDSKKKAIIVVPQTIIGKGFKSKIFKLPNDNVVDWSIGLDLVSESNDNFNQLVSFIIDDIHYSKEYPFERVAVCSRETLIGAFKKLSDQDKEKYWDNLLICIDETHHLQMNEISDGVYEMNKLSQIVDYSFKNNNNEIILVSATMFRGDKKGLISNEMISQAINYKLPFDIYMGEMNYLKSFSYDFVINTGDYTNDISKSIKNLFDDDLKKLFIYIPHTKHFMSTGNKNREDKKKEIKEILNQLKIVLNGESISLNEKTGVYHIQNSYGLDYKVCDLYDEELFDSKTKHFVNDEKINEDRDSLDCIITMNRGKEGFDWEHANGMVIVGKRDSLTDVIQMVGRLLRDKKGKEKVKVLHMLPFSPQQPIAPNLDNSLNDFFKAISISLLMEDVFTPNSIQANDCSTRGQLSGSSSSSSSNNIFDDLGLDENFIVDLFDKAQKSLVNIAGSLVESQGTYSPEELKEQMPSIVKKWVEDNDIEADEGQIEELASKVYNQFARRTLQMQGLNVSSINWQMIESADPIEFTLRYVGKDTTLKSLKELRILIAFGESESNKKCHIVCQRINNFGYPENGFVDEEGLNHYNFIHNRKQAKRGKGETAWYQTDQDIANSYGLNNLFDLIDNKQINLNNTQYCIDYHEKNGKYPTRWSGSEEDRKKAEWLSRQKSTNKKNEYFNLCQEYAISKGHPNLFKNQNRVEEMQEKILSLFQWIFDNNKDIKPNEKIKKPRKNSQGVENIHYNLIQTLRKTRIGKSENKWHPAYDDLFEKYNMWELILIPKELSFKKTEKLNTFCTDNKRAPISSDQSERELYDFYSKRASGKTKWHPEELEILEKNDTLKYLISSNQKRINKWISDIEILSKFIDDNDKLPSKKTHSKELNTLQECKRRFDQGNLDQVIIDTFAKFGKLDYLKFVDKKTDAKKKFVKLCTRLQSGSRPSKNSGGEFDAELAEYMSTLLKGLRGKRSFENYDFYSELAKELKVQHFFEGLL